MQASAPLQDLLARIRATPWHQYALPPYSKPDDVPRALERAARGDRSRSDYLLDAVGHNHSGVYYPVLLAALPFLEEMLISCDEDARHVVLEALLDLCTFEGSAAFEHLENEVGARMRAMRPVLTSLAAMNRASSAQARTLIDWLNESA